MLTNSYLPITCLLFITALHFLKKNILEKGVEIESAYQPITHITYF
jgi:hypothetical protein